MSPLKYLHIRSSTEKKVAARRAYFSMALAFLFVWGLHLFDNMNLYGNGGLIDRVGDFISTLTGFYVAALVAVATFGPGRPEMDGKMVHGKLHFIKDGEKEEISRREYLTALFGYLVALAFALSLTSIVVAVAGGSFSALSDGISPFGYTISYHSILSYTVALVYFSALFHLVGETSIGLHYLIEKLYLVKPGIKKDSIRCKAKQVTTAGDSETDF